MEFKIGKILVEISICIQNIKAVVIYMITVLTILMKNMTLKITKKYIINMMRQAQRKVIIIIVEK